MLVHSIAHKLPTGRYASMIHATQYLHFHSYLYTIWSINQLIYSMNDCMYV